MNLIACSSHFKILEIASYIGAVIRELSNSSLNSYRSQGLRYFREKEHSDM